MRFLWLIYMSFRLDPPIHISFSRLQRGSTGKWVNLVIIENQKNSAVADNVSSGHLWSSDTVAPTTVGRDHALHGTTVRPSRKTTYSTLDKRLWTMTMITTYVDAKNSITMIYQRFTRSYHYVGRCQVHKILMHKGIRIEIKPLLKYAVKNTDHCRHGIYCSKQHPFRIQESESENEVYQYGIPRGQPEIYSSYHSDSDETFLPLNKSRLIQLYKY